MMRGLVDPVLSLTSGALRTSRATKTPRTVRRAVTMLDRPSSRQRSAHVLVELPGGAVRAGRTILGACASAGRSARPGRRALLPTRWRHGWRGVRGAADSCMAGSTWVSRPARRLRPSPGVPRTVIRRPRSRLRCLLGWPGRRRPGRRLNRPSPSRRGC